MVNDWIILLLLAVVIYIEYTVQRRHLGIILLHNNDHTLMKPVQYISAFFERLDIHYTIVVIKDKNSKKLKRSTGKLFNIGYRQLPKMNSYLFIDSKYCKLDQYLNLVKKPSNLTEEQIYQIGSIQFIGDMCGVLLSRDDFKKMDGFSNMPNKNFEEFSKTVSDDRSSKDTYGGYMSTNIGTKYHIIEKNNITTHAIRISIEMDR